MARVSWLMPFRNAEQWIGEAVASMLADSAPEDELILVDDGSSDRSVQCIPEDSRIRLLSQSALGIVAALERGRQAAKAEFIARMDADDRTLPGRIDAQLEALNADPQLAAVGGTARPHPDGLALGEGMDRYMSWVNGLENPHPQLLVESPLFHPAVCFRASAVESVGGYRDGTLPEDYDLWLRLVSAGYRLRNLPQEVVEIRDRPERLTRSDPRYSKAAFRQVRQEFLERGPLAHPSKIVVWGGRKGARPWIQWLKANAHQLVAVVDIVDGQERGGSPLVRPDALKSLNFDVLLVSVGRRGARDLIRQDIQRLRPDLVEGRDWFAVL